MRIAENEIPEQDGHNEQIGKGILFQVFLQGGPETDRAAGNRGFFLKCFHVRLPIRGGEGIIRIGTLGLSRVITIQSRLP